MMLIRELQLIMRNFFSGDYELVIRQKPLAAKAFVGKEKDRKPIDPPPIIQLRVSESVDPAQSFLQSPYYFISCSLVDDESRPQVGKDEIKNALAGTLVSSLHRLKDTDNTDAGFFVFGDLSVKMEGLFKLQFTLYEFRETEVAYINSTTSDPFTVYASKNWPGMAESTVLTRSFSDQGVRLRLRKEPRFRLGARGPASDNYEPRRYKTHNRKQSQTDLPPLTEVSQHPQQLYQHPQESISSLRHVQSGYSGRVQQQQQQRQQTAWQTPISPTHLRKRDHSQSSFDTSYASNSTHSTQMSDKRARLDPEPPQQSYSSQQYLLAQEYSGRVYSDPNQATGFPSYSHLSPHQLYGSAYTSSPLAMTPRDQGNIYVPRRGESQYPSISSTYDLPGGRQPNNLTQQSPISAFGYNPGLSSISQTPYSTSQNQYVPQLTQPTPPSRPLGTVGTYHGQPDVEQQLMHPRPGARPAIDVLPPVFGGAAVIGTGRTNTGNNLQLSQSGAEDARLPRNYAYGFKPADNAPPR